MKAGMKPTDTWDGGRADEAIELYTEYAEALRHELEAMRAAERTRAGLILASLRARRQELEERLPDA
jgi:hypothetical protein